MARSHLSTNTINTPMSALPFGAIRAVFKQGYSRTTLKADVLAGLVVGVVALPLAMALAIAVGVPPQHGLYTSIIAGVIIGLLGGSRFQISGPTAAFIVILSPIFIKFGLAGLLTAGAMAGVILLLMGISRLGQLIQFIPHPVTTGFTAGIGTVIAFLQMKDFFGITPDREPHHFVDRVISMIQAFKTANLAEFAVGASTLFLLLMVPRVIKKIPAPLIVLTGMGVLTWILHKYFPIFEVATIQSRFNGIPQMPPQFHWPWQLAGAGGKTAVFSISMIQELVPAAFAIAILGAIESLLSAVIADAMGGTRHDPDGELIALGVGNIICPFFGGIAATGAIARTATNIRYGAKSPISSVVHAATVLAAILLLAPFLGYLPMASMAALLMLVAWNMSDAKHFVHILKVAPRSDIFILLTCYFLTVTFDMVIAVTVGVLLASILFMQRMASTASSKLMSSEDPHFQGKLPKGVMVYEIAGPLFFGAADKAMSAMRAINNQTKTVVLNMRSVPIIDETGLVALESALARLRSQNIRAMITDLQAQPARVLDKAGIRAEVGKLEFRISIEAALTELRDTTKAV